MEDDYVSDSQSEAGTALGVEVVDRHRLERLIDAIADPELRETQRTRFHHLLPTSPQPQPTTTPHPPQPSLASPQPEANLATLLPLWETAPRRRQLRKRAFAAIYPYIADQIKYLRLANINDVNALYQDSQDVHAVVKTLDGMYQRHKRRFPHDDKYKPHSFYSVLGQHRRKPLGEAVPASQASQASQVSQEPEPQSQSLPDLVADEIFDFEASEASHDSDSDNDDDDNSNSDDSDAVEAAIRVGGRIVSHRLALRGVLPELAKRQAIWKPRAQPKRPRVVTPDRKGVARIKPLNRRHHSDRNQLLNELINDADDENDDTIPVVLTAPVVEAEADVLAREAQRFEQYAYVFDDVDPNEPEPVYPQLDTTTIEPLIDLTGPSSPPPLEAPPSPITVYSDDSDILEYDRVVLDVPSRTSQFRKPPAPRKPQASSRRPRQSHPTIRPSHQPRIRARAPARVQARLVLENTSRGNQYHRELRRVANYVSTKSLTAANPLTTAKPQITAKASTTAKPKAKPRRQARLPSPFAAPQFTLQIEAEAPHDFVQRRRFPPLIPPPRPTSLPVADFDIDKMAKGTFFMEVTHTISFPLGVKHFVLSPLQQQSDKVYYLALSALADHLDTTYDLTGVFVSLARWQVFLRPQNTQDLLKQLVVRCRTSRWLPYIMLLALAAEQRLVLEQAALRYWQALWQDEEVPTALASDILRATRLWIPLLALALTKAPLDCLESAVTMAVHAIDQAPASRDWTIIYAFIRRIGDCDDSTFPHRVIDLILHVHFAHQWELEERVVIELYGIISRRKFANFPDECHDPEVISVVQLRDDFGSSFFDRFLMIIYLYVGDLPVEDHQAQKRRLNAKLYTLLLLQYHELRDQYIVYVNRLNFALLLHQVLGLLLRTQFDQLVSGVVSHALTVEYTTLNTSVQAVLIYCATTTTNEAIPGDAFAALMAKFGLGYLRIPRIKRIWRLFMTVLRSLQHHRQFADVLAKGLLSSLPSTFAKDIILLSRNIPANQNVCDKAESLLHRAMVDGDKMDYVLLLCELWVRAGRDNPTRLVFGKLPYIGDDRLRQFYAPLVLAWVLRFALPTIKQTLEDACYDRVWQLLIMSLAPSPYLGQLLSGLSLPTTMGSNTDMIVRLLDDFRKQNNTKFIRGYLDQVKAYWNLHRRDPKAHKLCQFCVVELKRRFASEVSDNRQFINIVSETQIDRGELDVIDWLRQPLRQKLQQFYENIAAAVENRLDVDKELRKYIRLDPEAIMYAMANYFRSWDQAVPWLLQVTLREWLKYLPWIRLSPKLIAFYREMLQWIVRYPQLENDVVEAIHQLLTKVSGYVDTMPREVAWEYIKGKQVDSEESLIQPTTHPVVPSTDKVCEPMDLPPLALNRHRLLNRLEETDNGGTIRNFELLDYEFAF